MTLPMRMVAFANAKGGMLLCGISDSGELPGMSPEQATALSLALTEISTDTLEPYLRIDVHERELNGKIFVLVEVPKGNFVHERAGQAFIRVGETKRSMGRDECL